MSTPKSIFEGMNVRMGLQRRANGKQKMVFTPFADDPLHGTAIEREDGSFWLFEPTPKDHPKKMIWRADVRSGLDESEIKFEVGTHYQHDPQGSYCVYNYFQFFDLNDLTYAKLRWW